MVKKEINPMVLIVMDGIGIGKSKEGNALFLAKTPNLDSFWTTYPHGLLYASGLEVGLGWGIMGGSEVGHLNLGSGRVIYQGMELINRFIASDEFFKNPALIKAINHSHKYQSNLHLMGLLSTGGVHASLEHLHSLLRFLKEKKFKNKVYIHLFADGRDMPPQSAPVLLGTLKEMIKETKKGILGTMIGRFYAMDRDNRWERVEKAYHLLTEGQGEKVKSFEEALNESYQSKIFDEFLEPKILIKKGFLGGQKDLPIIKDNDAVVFYNFRADRAKQLTQAFVLDNFDKFERKKIKNLFFATMTEYEKDLPVEVIVYSGPVPKTLGEVVSSHKLKQLHITENEKRAHVTFFFNGKREEAFPGEERIILPSVGVGNYAKRPEMSAYEITERLIKEIKNGAYSFIIVNYANGDMVGHTGDLEAAIKAVEVVDECVGKVVAAVLSKGGKVFITADHGNCEEMINLQTKKRIAEHSENLVPFIIIDKDKKYKIGEKIVEGEGILADVAPTILYIINLPVPVEMTGGILLEKDES